MLKIEKPIVGYSVKESGKEDEKDVAKKAGDSGNVDASASEKSAPVSPIRMNEGIGRPEVLLGVTYKIKSPMVEHALYVTLNDLVLNAGTDQERRRPFEIFINSKNMEHFQWIVALTRIMSAVFRKGGEVAFLVDEVKAVFDPRGGYFKPGGVFVPSLVAEIGLVIERHLQDIGMLSKPELSDAQKALIAEKRAAFEAAPVAVIDTHSNADGSYSMSGSSDLPESAFWPIHGKRVRLVIDEDGTDGGDLQPLDSATGSNKEFAGGTGDADTNYPASATVCTKCSVKAVIVMDGCQTCLSCADSKCG